MQISLGLPDPREQSSLPVLKRVQAGISRLQLLKDSPPKLRLPITAKILSQMKSVLSEGCYPEKTLLWAVCCTAFFGFFRLGELLVDNPKAFCSATDLAWGDIAVDNPAAPQMVRIHLKTSKTDQLGAGSDIIIGRTDSNLCPVSAILSYISLRGTRPGPFFIDSTARPLTKARFVAALRGILARVGLPEHHFAGHSFRIGAATSAALAGVEDSTIQTLGRWHSTAFLRYIRMPQEQLAALSAVLAATVQSSHQ